MNFFSYLCNVEWKIIHIEETDSTNQWLLQGGAEGRDLRGTCLDTFEVRGSEPSRYVGRQEPPTAALVVWADYQTAGRGQGTNRWESERGKNLLFSLLIHPIDVPVNRQFHISMAISLAICEALGQHIGDLSIKWPNDIYWRNGKIGGILIVHAIHGNHLKDSIIGVGLNVNQRTFHSDAPNPVSMWQICEHETDRKQLLDDILRAFDRKFGRDIKAEYLSMLYRRKGFHPYCDKEGAFMAEIDDVEDDGHLLLRDDNGRMRRYAFKEVSFII